MGDADDAISENIEVVPVVVVSQTFPARPSSIPDIRDFVRRCLAQSPLSEEDNREVGETVAQALLDAAGPTGAINVRSASSPTTSRSTCSAPASRSAVPRGSTH